MIKIVAAYSALAMLGLSIGGVWGSSESHPEAAPRVTHTSIPTSVMTVRPTPTSTPVYHTPTPAWTPQPTRTTKPTPTASWTPTPEPSVSQTTEEPTATPTVTETPTPSASASTPDPSTLPTTTPSTYAPLG